MADPESLRLQVERPHEWATARRSKQPLDLLRELWTPFLVSAQTFPCNPRQAWAPCPALLPCLERQSLPVATPPQKGQYPLCIPPPARLRHSISSPPQTPG